MNEVSITDARLWAKNRHRTIDALVEDTTDAVMPRNEVHPELWTGENWRWLIENTRKK